jgi:hypothetical protein
VDATLFGVAWDRLTQRSRPPPAAPSTVRRSEFGGVPARRGRAGTQRWTVSRIPTGWTVFQVPSTPKVPAGRSIQPLRYRLGASQERLLRLARTARQPVAAVAQEKRRLAHLAGESATVASGGATTYGRARRGAGIGAAGKAAITGLGAAPANSMSGTRRGREERGRLVVGPCQGRSSEDGGVVTALGVRHAAAASQQQPDAMVVRRPSNQKSAAFPTYLHNSEEDAIHIEREDL